MSADPYLTPEDFVELLEFGLDADTCADEAYGDQWDRMDAYLAEGIPWPKTPLMWDSTEAWAKVLAGLDIYRGKNYGWGVYLIGSRGATAAQREQRAREERLLQAIFGETP